MRWLLLALLTIHGLVHFLGFAKAFGLAELPELGHSISRVAGVGWLAAGTGFLIAAALLVSRPHVWWVAGLGAVVLSQAVIFGSWSDAKYGTLANLIVLAAAAYAFASEGHLGLGAR